MDKIKSIIHKYLDPKYGFHVATELKKFVNSDLGGRTAGSLAEHKAAEWLTGEMKGIGLSEVSKKPFPCDTWQFNGSTLKILNPKNSDKIIKPYAYPSGATPSEGIIGELLFIGKGTKQNYSHINAKGKIVLIEIDMKEDWWITLPTLEAELQGASAIINYCSGGYGQLNADTMNTQNFAGPPSIPSVNISRNDANYLKGLLDKGMVHINLAVDNVLKSGGTSHNIIGILPGKRDDEYIICGDHYDCHFWGVQDNNAGVAMTLAIAKAMIDARYQPERSIIFILHGAEEWGAIDSPYDFAIGGWHQVFTINPEWVGKSLVFINFEHPAHSFGDTFYARSTPEFYSFLQDCYASAPDKGDLFQAGFTVEGQHFGTDVDGWSYAISGIPVIVNGRAPLTGRNNYYLDIYHSNFDDTNTWESDIFLYNLKFYSDLITAIDERPGLSLDFSQQARRLKESINEDLFTKANIDPNPFLSAIKAFESASENMYAKIGKLNEQYAEAIGDPKNLLQKRSEIRYLTQTINDKMLASYKIIFKSFYKMDFNDVPIFGHEHPQKNILLLTQAIDALNGGNATPAIERALERIDENKLCRYFSKDTLLQRKQRLLDPGGADRLFWAKDKIVTPLDLFEVIQSLIAKSQSMEKDFTDELIILKKELNIQKSTLESSIKTELKGLKQIMKLF